VTIGNSYNIECSQPRRRFFIIYIPTVLRGFSRSYLKKNKIALKEIEKKIGLMSVYIIILLYETIQRYTENVMQTYYVWRWRSLSEMDIFVSCTQVVILAIRTKRKNLVRLLFSLFSVGRPFFFSSVKMYRLKNYTQKKIIIIIV